MAAKLDTSRPLRLIGIQIFEGTHKNVRKVLEEGWYPFVKCENSRYIGVEKEVYPIVAEDGCPQDYYWIDKKRLPRISISAIAGKNGSGKSSLVEILYRILNNFAEELLQTEENKPSEDVDHVYGLEARLHFEQDGVQKFINLDDGGTTYYEVVDGKAEPIRIHLLTEKQRNEVLNGFFYTICVNFSLYAFNPDDYKSLFSQRKNETDNGNWLSYLFHKNDGYYIPIVLTPFREKGQIDVNNENELAKQRIEVLSLMFHSQKKEFLDDYVPKKLSYRYINDYWEKKEKTLYDKPIRSELRDVQDILIFNLEQKWEDLLTTKLGRLFDTTTSDRDKNALYYLAYKTLKMCSIYPEYREASNMDTLLETKKQVISEKTGKTLKDDDGNEILMVDPNSVASWQRDNDTVLDEVVSNVYDSVCNHVTLKIHQCLDYLKGDSYKEDEETLDVDEKLLKDETVETYDDMMRLLPPPFFMTEVTYEKKSKKNQNEKKTEVTLQSMSSGERQMLYSLSYIYYHIKNIASIKENGKRVVGYHHVNLIFDEAELYYHPEYQRQYITRLLEHLAMCNINRTNIRSINIIIITHSPFILSDLPETNILFLKKGDEATDEVPRKTLGANIYDLLKSGFFLDYAIGDVAQKKLQDIMTVYYDKTGKEQQVAFEEKKAEFKFTIDHLGEDYLRRNFQHIYDEMDMKFGGQTRKAQLEARMAQLKAEMENLKEQMAEA